MASSLTFVAPFAVFLFAYFAAVPALALSDADVKRLTVSSLTNVPVGKDHHGRDFYKYFFTQLPESRKYFKGDENISADDVEKSERFEKQGKKFLLAVHVVANIFDNEPVFRAYVRDNIDKHLTRGIEPSLWKKIWDIWMSFLESKGTPLSADQKAAWQKLGERFNEESQAELAKRGLPHV